MARTPSGLKVIEQARKQLREAQGIAELKSAQAVVFPLDFGMSMEETSKAIGISKGWACQLRRHFIAQHSLPDVGTNVPKSKPEKVRNRAYMKSCEEKKFLEQFTEKAAEAGILIVSEIRQALEQKLGHTTAQATVYNLLHRHGWRKLVPDKRHPKADVKTQEDWKKNSSQRSGKLTKTGQAKERGQSA